MGFDEAEGLGIVEQCHVHTTAIGAVEMHIAITASGQSGFAEEVIEGATIFDLAETDDCGTGGVFLVAELCTQFAQHLSDVVELGGVLLFCPLIRTGGQKLIVVLAGIVLRVEEVFDVVESHTVKHFLLCRGGKNPYREKEE